MTTQQQSQSQPQQAPASPPTPEIKQECNNNDYDYDEQEEGEEEEGTLLRTAPPQQPITRGGRKPKLPSTPGLRPGEGKSLNISVLRKVTLMSTPAMEHLLTLNSSSTTGVIAYQRRQVDRQQEVASSTFRRVVVRGQLRKPVIAAGAVTRIKLLGNTKHLILKSDDRLLHIAPICEAPFGRHFLLVLRNNNSKKTSTTDDASNGDCIRVVCDLGELLKITTALDEEGDGMIEAVSTAQGKYRKESPRVLNRMSQQFLSPASMSLLNSPVPPTARGEALYGPVRKVTIGGDIELWVDSELFTVQSTSSSGEETLMLTLPHPPSSTRPITTTSSSSSTPHQKRTEMEISKTDVLAPIIQPPQPSSQAPRPAPQPSQPSPPVTTAATVSPMMVMMSAPMQLASSAPLLTTPPQAKKMKQEELEQPPPKPTQQMVEMKACECVGRLSALVEWALSWRNRVENKEQVLSMFSKLLEQVREQKKCLGFCRELFVCRAHWKPHHTTKTRLSSTMPPPSATSPNDLKSRPWLCVDCDSDISPPSTPTTTTGGGGGFVLTNAPPMGRHNTIHDYLYWNEQKAGYRTVQSNYNPAINRIVSPQTYQQRPPLQLTVSPKSPLVKPPPPPPPQQQQQSQQMMSVMFMIQSEPSRRRGELIDCIMKGAANVPFQMHLTHLTRDILSNTPHPTQPSSEATAATAAAAIMAKVVRGRVAFDCVFGVRPLFYLLDGFPLSCDDLELLADENINIHVVFSLTQSSSSSSSSLSSFSSSGVIKMEGLGEQIFWTKLKQSGCCWVEVSDQASLEATASAVLTKLCSVAHP